MTKLGTKFKFTEEQLIAAGKHAAERGMTLEEYIQEFVGLLNEHNKKVLENSNKLDNQSIQDEI